MTTEPHPSDRVPDTSSTIDVSAREAASRRSGSTRALLFTIAFGLVAVLVLQVLMLTSMSDTDDQLQALGDRVDAVGEEVATVRGAVDGLEDAVDAADAKLDDLAAGGLVSASASGSSTVETSGTPDGTLPPFEQGQPDAALGVVLGDVSGPEYYTGVDITVDPTDGVARAWLVWAHWCPYCQRELPAVSEWYLEHAGDYPDVEIISITSSIDETRGNPLEPYLDDLQLPFPAIVDADLSLAQQLGVNAYPFWVFTDPEGTTVLRIAGYLETPQIEALFNELQSLASAE